MGDGPGLRGAPAAGPTGYGAATLARFNSTDLQNGFTGSSKRWSDGVNLAGFDDHRHSDSAVESPRHLAWLDVATLLEKLEQARLLPSVGFYDSMTVIR